MLLMGAEAVLGDQVQPASWVQIEDSLIAAIGSGAPPADVLATESSPTDLAGAVVTPGFVDQHCHGGNHGDFFTADRDAALTGANFHAQHGTTTLIASLVTASPAALQEQVSALLPLVDDATFAGIHLEGPWISPAECGAHDPTLLRDPDLGEISALLDLARGAIRMVTIAPELTGALEAIELLHQRGVVVAIGHTDADYDLSLAAIDAGASVATHLLNCMPAMVKRAPGPAVALANDPRVSVELIADGVHIHPALIHLVGNAVGADRVVAVTDAIGAAGAADGEYLIGELAVTVTDGVARLTDSGALAGSTLTMDTALRTLVRQCQFALPDAVAMCTSNPARAMGLIDRGSLVPGQRADLVVLDEEFAVRRVMRAGQWLDGRP